MKKMMFLIACVLCTVAGYAQQGPLATTQYGVLEGVCESGVNVARRAQCEEIWRRPHAGQPFR